MLVPGAAALLLGTPQLSADVGDIVAVIVPQPSSAGSPCSIGLAFDGTALYFDRCADPLIYRVSVVDGSSLGSFDPGIPELPNAMAFDAKRNGLWIACQTCTGFGMPIYFYDFDTASSSVQFFLSFDGINPATGESFVNQCFARGLAYNENVATTDADDELYFSDRASRNLGLFRPDGTLVAGFDATSIDPSLASQSGLAVGGRSLYLGKGADGDILRASLPALALVDQFATLDSHQADMECDPITFSPTEVLWVRTTPEGGLPDVITAFEIEPGTCGLGGGLQECFTLDFESDDSGDALAHGARIDDEFDGGLEFPVTITSSSNTAAVLDSSTGPALQDPDLLVGSGNILILQTDADLRECPPASGVYCSHNDDEDGGTLRFAFNTTSRANSIDLVDIDASDPASSVVLIDLRGNTRTYTVPSNWTGDFVTDGPPGMGTLDLTTLAPQPGFGSVATASEQDGFAADAVVRVHVHLGGSGGIDNLSWCPVSLVARVVSRNGSGRNRTRLTALSMPRIGATWGAELDCRGFGNGVATLIVRPLATSGVSTRLGEVLVAGNLLFLRSQVFAGNVSRMTGAIPNYMSLCGLQVHAQGLCQGVTSTCTPMSLRLEAGLSNALDLTLGF